MNQRHTVAVYARMALSGVLVMTCLWQFVSLGKAFGIKDQRVVQILKSRDGAHTAELTRRYAVPDLNFILELNGEKIYASPKFKADYTVPFRETLLWDKTGRNLILEIAGRRFFGYDIGSKKALSAGELQNLKVEALKPEIFGLRGQWPPVGK